LRLNETRSSKLPISVTPLIDVVFLLLIFFMLVSTFLKFNSIPIAAVESGHASADISEIVLIQLLDGKRQRVNGVLVPLDGLAPHLDNVVAKGMTKAIIKPTPEATAQDLVSVLERIRTSTLTSVVIAH